MAELPKGWALCAVGDIFDSYGGGTPNRSTPSYWNGTIPWLSSGDIKVDRIDSASESISRAGLENSTAKLCRPGSLVIVVRSGILKHTLPVAVLAKEAAINQDIKCFDSGDDQLNHWFLLYLKARAKEILAQNREGTTVQSVKHDTLLRVALPVPPAKEQRRIVAKLEELLQKVDLCDGRLERIPAILRRFRQSVLAAACSGRLTEDWRKAHPKTQSAKEMLSQQGIAPVLPIEDDGGFPTTWINTTLRTIVPSFQNGVSKRRSVSGRPTVVLRLADVVRDSFEAADPREIRLSAKEVEKNNVTSADILIVRVNGSSHIVGRFLHHRKPGPWAYCDHFIRLRLNEQILDPKYLVHVASTPSARVFIQQNMVSSAGQNTVSQQTLSDLPLALPPIEEQREIVRRLDVLFGRSDQIEARCADVKASVNQLAHVVLSKAFRGNLVPQDPKDEPAAKFLERIRGKESARPLAATRA